MHERSEAVYQTIKARAISYAFPPGKRILLGPLAEELGTSKHQVRETLIRLVSEGWVIQAPNKGFLAISLDAALLADYHDVNTSLLVLALHAAESGRTIRPNVLDRIEIIICKLSPFEGDAESLATVIGNLFSAIAALGGNRVEMQLVESCNEHLYFAHTRGCQYLEGVTAELVGLCELALARQFAGLRQAIVEYHTRRKRLPSSWIRILSAGNCTAYHE